tara:strand:- start:363 stop:905 length:543 start_codon:yes stop_codon:yes gene_type:complete
MKVFDNFLPQEQFDELFNRLISNKIDWHKSSVLGASKFLPDPIFNIQFCHRFIEISTEWVDGVQTKYELTKGKNYDIIEPILDKISYKELIRIKANITVGRETQKLSGYHIDVAETPRYERGMTGIYYVNTNNGFTSFLDGTEVKSVANRFLMFPCHMKHSSVPCTDHRHRIVINFNWIP